MHPDQSDRLAGATILCLAPDPWRGLWRNRHQIMTRLARRNLVLYVEPRIYLWDALRRFRDGRLRPADLRRPLAEHYADGLWIYHDPYYAPFAGRLSGGPLTAALRRRALRTTLRRLGGSQPILWLLRPYQADQIGRHAERLVVYHVTDEYAAFPEVRDRAAFEAAEEALLHRADLVIVTAPGLLARRARINPHTHLVPNAVDYEGFRRRLAAAPAAAPRPQPRIGYAGALNEKVDYRLLAAIARGRPDWQLVLIGLRDLNREPRKADVLDGLPNVQWTGCVPVDELPQAIAGLDVCLLPYERNEWTANIDSLKLYEYLACGKPVVGSDVPASHAFDGAARAGEPPPVYVAADAAGFIAAIEAALAEDPAAAAARLALAAAHTWEDRVARIEALLIEALAARAAAQRDRP